MKRRNNRFLAGTLAGLMMLTMLPVTALAAEEGAADETTTLTTTDGTPVPGASDNGIENVVNDTGDSQDTGANADANDTGDTSQTAGNDGGKTGTSVGGNDGQPGASGNEGEGGSGSGNTADTTPAVGQFVAKIVTKTGTQTYETLEKAINAAQDGDTIEIGQDITVEEGGLSFVKKGTLTIKGVGESKPTITMNNLGMYFNETDVTFKNVKVVEESIIHNPCIDNPLRSGYTANLADDSTLTLDNASLVLDGPKDGTGGHGLYLYQESNLYVKNGSTVTVSGFNNSRASGIYADESEYEGMPNRNIQVIGNSSITVSDCAWNGMTIDPIDLLIDDKSTVDISDCGKNGGRGGLGCYYGSVEISNSSSLIADDNVGRSWGAFVRDVSVDSTSSLSACRNTTYGLKIGDKLGSESNFAAGSTVTLNKNDRAGLCVYSDKNNFWFGNVRIEEGANFTASFNKEHGIEVCPKGALNMQGGTVTDNETSSYGGGLYNRGGTVEVGGTAVICNNYAEKAGDDIVSQTDIYTYYINENKDTKSETCVPSLTLSPVGEWTLDKCKDPIVGWYQDGERQRWNGDATDDSYYADEYTVSADAVSDALALKAAHGKFCNVTYEVTGDVPSDAGDPPASAKVKMGGSYTVAPAQTTSQSRYTFSGWRINGVGDVVTEIKDIQQDVINLVGVWSYRSGGGSSGGGGGRKPTVDIPDDVPTGLNGDDHFAYIVGYPDGNVKPGSNITRAEAMTLVNRVLNRLPEKSEDLLDDMIKWPDNADASVWYYLAVQEATNSHDYSDKSDADKYEKWTKIRDARDWTLLEK